MSIPSSLTPLFNSGSSAAAAALQIERSLRFNSSDSAYLSRTPAVAGNRQTWTWAGWVKRSNTTTDNTFFSTTGSDDNTLFSLGMTGLSLYVAGAATPWLTTTLKLRDPSAWFHLQLSTDTTQATSSDRYKLYMNGIQITSFTTQNYPTPNQQLGVNTTLNHNIGAYFNIVPNFDGYLADVYFIDGQALTPSSFTEVSATTGQLIPKTYSGSYGTNGFQLKFADNSSNTAATLGKDTSGNSNNWTPNNLSVYSGTTQGVNLRDSSRITLSGGRTGATNTALLVDGVLTYSQTFYGNPGANGSYIDFSTSGLTVGNTVFVRYWNAAEAGGQTITATCDQRNSGGTQIASTAVAQTWTGGQKYNDGTGYISQTLQSGVSTIRLTFSNNSNNSYGWGVGEIEFLDGSGNDSLVDTPTSYGTDTGVGGEVRGNYCTMNPLEKANNASVQITNGNLTYKNVNTDNNWRAGRCSIAMPPGSGKWYYEQLIVVWDYTAVGVAAITVDFAVGVYPGSGANSVGYWLNGGYFFNGGSGPSVGQTFGNGDLIGIAIDMDNLTLQFYKNGVANTILPAAITAGLFYAPVYGSASNGSNHSEYNFGQRAFAYTAPSGFKALCDTNLPAPLVAKPNTVMDVKLWTGTGAARSITGLAFNPDWVWIKSRSSGAYNHRVFDTVRGATKELYTSLTNAEATSLTSLTSFNSDGFSLDSDPGVNETSTTYVGWAWDAGTSTVSNTSGSITSQVRANASAGFSIVTYTGNGVDGATIGHGLGVTPGMIIVKNRDNSNTFWPVAHRSIANGVVLALNSTNATMDHTQLSRGIINNLNSTTFAAKAGTFSNESANGNGEKCVAYCFAPVAGYSSFGSYTGNGSADGPFVYTGFRPRYLCIKSTSFSDQWLVLDAARNTYNVVNLHLHPNLANSEASLDWLDFTANGFKIRTTYSTVNQSSGSFIYFAFAENPFQYARAR